MGEGKSLPNDPSTDRSQTAIPDSREPTPVKSKGYRVVAVSLYSPEADWIDQVVWMLQRSGNPKANRSFVVREAILRLQEDLSAKEPGQVLRDFIDRQARRAPPAQRRGSSA